MKLILSRLTPTKKVKVLYSIPDQNLHNNILTQLKKIYEKYNEENPDDDIHCYDPGSYLSYIFKANSVWYPDVKETLMLTLYLEEHENTHFFKPVIENTISELQAIENLTKILSVNTPHAEKESYTILGRVINILTDCFFEASNLHSTYNLGLSEVLVLGDKGSGKTSIIDYLIHGKFIQQPTPTLTPQIFQMIYDQTDFRVLDICCEEHLKEVFEEHPIEKGKLPQGIVYVVDATHNKESLKDSVKRFHHWIQFLINKYSESIFKKIPLLILFNKVDLNPQFNLKEHREMFTPKIDDLNVKYSTSSVKTGRGLDDNFSWLVKKIKITGTY